MAVIHGMECNARTGGVCNCLPFTGREAAPEQATATPLCVCGHGHSRMGDGTPDPVCDEWGPGHDEVTGIDRGGCACTDYRAPASPPVPATHGTVLPLSDADALADDCRNAPVAVAQMVVAYVRDLRARNKAIREINRNEAMRAHAAERALAEARAEVERLATIARDLLADLDNIRATAKHMTTWSATRDWFKVHPDGGEVVVRARAALSPRPSPAPTEEP